MNARAWYVLFVTAFTDFSITAVGGLTTAMVSTGTTQLPSKAVVLLCLLFGFSAGMRTIQQALRRVTPLSELK